MIGATFEANIKYDLLDNLLKETLNNVKYSNNVNVIIDLKSIYRKVFRTDINNVIPDIVMGAEDVTSTIINIIGHYRNYLFKMNKYSTFYILYSINECEKLQNIYPDYKKYYYNKYLNNKEEYKQLDNIVKTANNSVKIVSKYIPNVFYIDTSDLDEFVYCNYIIRNISKTNDLNILLSSDPIMYQTLDNKTFAIDLKGQHSKVITENNVLSYLTETNAKISGNLLNLMLSICGNTEYNLQKIDGIGFKKAYKIIKSLVDNNIVVDKMHMILPKEIFKDNLLNENKELIETNFKTVFPINIQLENENTLIRAFAITKPVVTKQQFDELNTRIFVNYPINIVSLLRGEQIS